MIRGIANTILYQLSLKRINKSTENLSWVTITIIARRLGMRWKDFRHADGVMRAEGAGYLITSASIRSFGTVLYYNTTSWSSPVTYIYGSYNQKVSIPTKECDTLGFELVLRVSSRFRVGTRLDVLTTLRTLEPTGNCATDLQNLYNSNPDYYLQMSDLSAMIYGRIIC